MDTPQVAVICVPERQKREYEFPVTRFEDTGHRGALWNHIQALEWASKQKPRVIVIEDDALPVEGFIDLASAWLDLMPDDLISFYLGKGAPIYRQHEIGLKIAEADRSGAHTVLMDTLLHGVCYSVPPKHIPGMIRRIEHTNRHAPADTTIGEAWSMETHRAVVYTLSSLVDHDDGMPCICEHHGRRPTVPRRAWRLP